MLRAAAMLAIIALVPGLAQAACQAIQAPATVRGRAPAETPFACYKLTGEPGQAAMVQIAQPNPSVAFNISGVVDNRSEDSFKMQAKPIGSRSTTWDRAARHRSP